MNHEQRCICSDLPDDTHINMGCEKFDWPFIATVENVKDRGGHPCWLHSARCRVCGQDWLIASDELIYDVYHVLKIAPEQAHRIECRNEWPVQFQTYEELLSRGTKLGIQCIFFDEIAGSLVWCVEELRRERPEITDREIARLLGIGIAQARRVIAAASPPGLPIVP